MIGNMIGYLRLITGPFFRWWWALVTGAVSLLAFVTTPQTGWVLKPIPALLVTMLLMTLAFLTVSVLTQGWQLYVRGLPELEIVGAQPQRDMSGGWVFLISGHSPIGTGAIVDVSRRMGKIEVPFALLEIVGTNSRGYYQGVLVSFAAGHLNDLAHGKFGPSDLVATPHIRLNRIKDNLNDISTVAQRKAP